MNGHSQQRQGVTLRAAGCSLWEYNAKDFWIREIRNLGKIHKRSEGERVLEERGAKILCQKDEMIEEKLSWKDLLKNDLENHSAWLLSYGFRHLSALVFVQREEKNSLFDRDNHPKGFAEFSSFSRQGEEWGGIISVTLCLSSRPPLDNALLIFFFKGNPDMCLKYSTVDQINLLPLWNYKF